MLSNTPNQAPQHPLYPEGIQLRLLKGLGANIFGQILHFTRRILLPPLFLRAWGVDIYGEWLLLSSFVAYLSLTDFGGQIYIINRLTQAYSRQDIALFRKVLHTGLVLFLILPSSVLVLFLGTIYLFSPERLLGIYGIGQKYFIWVLAFLAAQYIFSLPQGLLLGFYRAVGLLPRGVMLGNLLIFLQLALTAGGLLLRGGMVWIAFVQVIPFLIVALIAARDLNGRFPQFSVISIEDADLSTARSFIRPSLHFFSIQLSQAFSIQGIVLIVGAVLGSVQVVVFSTLRTMVNVMRQFLGVIAHTAWPELTRLDAEQGQSKLLALFRVVLRSTLLTTMVFIAILHFLGGQIYGLWLGSAVAYRQTLMDLFLVYVLQLVFWTACSNLLMAVNVHHTLSKILLLSSILSLIFAYFGGVYLSLEGIILGMILADALLPLWLVPYLITRYQASFSVTFWLREIIPFIGAFPSMMLIPWSTPVVFFVILIWWARSLPEVGLDVWRRA